MAILGPILGCLFVGLLFWAIGSDAMKARKSSKEYVNAYDLERKVFFQEFILATKRLYPEAKISFGVSDAILVSNLLNSNSKKIGTIELSGYKLKYDNFYKLKITIYILDHQYIEIENFVQTTLKLY